MQAKPNLPLRNLVTVIADNNFNMESTWKVATRPIKSRSRQQPSSPKQKKQPKTQTATTESRNLRQRKSRNKKIHNHPKKTVFRKTQRFQHKSEKV